MPLDHMRLNAETGELRRERPAKVGNVQCSIALDCNISGAPRHISLHSDNGESVGWIVGEIETVADMLLTSNAI